MVDQSITDSEFYDGVEDLARTGTPLRRFWGTVEEVTPRASEYQTMVEINSKDIEIIPYPADHLTDANKPGSVVPYDFPIASINIRYRLGRNGRPSEQGAWGLFLSSLHNAGVSRARELIGKRVLFESEPNHVYRPAGGVDAEGNPQEAITGMVWRLANDSSSASETPVDEVSHMVGLLGAGKTAQEFANVALQDTLGRQRQQGIIDGSILAGLVATGRVILEGDTYIPKS